MSGEYLPDWHEIFFYVHFINKKIHIKKEKKGFSLPTRSSRPGRFAGKGISFRTKQRNHQQILDIRTINAGKNRWSEARNRGERESEHVKRSRTFMLVRRTGDSSSAEGLNPGGIVRHGARAIGSRAGDIDLYLAPFAPASGEAPGSGLPSFPSPDPSNRSSGAGGRLSAAPQPRSPAADSGFPSISGSNRKWGGRGEWQWGRRREPKGADRSGDLGNDGRGNLGNTVLVSDNRSATRLTWKAPLIEGDF